MELDVVCSCVFSRVCVCLQHINVILTNRKSLLQNVMNFSCGLSDVHNLIAVQIKSNTPSLKNPYKTYRSYKQFFDFIDQISLCSVFIPAVS
jgi:hypothetical protein